ncbi:MAG: UDP-2,3-diacylglucosamine diphosphatase [Gammaproteobacteria bacterium]|nr:UDP-2,3-diacylglucosamine diphosphatase [Gammaproteobacteria bacterium]
MSSLFISDLHLHAGAPAVSEQARRLLDEFAPRFQNLFILGDFVEYWLGDDAADGSLSDVFDALKNLSASGTRIFLMHGNRDFLLGEGFADSIGATLVSDDQYLIDDEGLRILLLHGDTLCTDDTAYQALRVMLRDPEWQADFLSKSIGERLAAANQLRETSREKTLEKSAAIMDVNQQSVEAALRDSGTHLMIHGHTHRPQTHRFELDGKTASRVVLGDWNANGAFIATLENAEITLQHWPAGEEAV